MAVEYVGRGGPDGTVVGSSATELVGFYGETPVAQRAAALQNGSGISATSSDWGATQVAWAVEVTATLNGLGIWKGSA